MTSDRKKVLFVVPSLAGGGAERAFSILLRHMDRGRFELHLAVLQAKGAYMQDVPEDVVIHNLKVSRVRYVLPSIVRLVWKLRPQSILSTLGHLNLVLALGKPLLPRGTRLLVREATIVSTFLLEETQHPRLWGLLYRHLYKRADKVVCLSDSMVDDLVEHFGLPRKKLVRIYNPVDVEGVRMMAEAGGNPYCGAGPHIVAAGRLSREKGLDILLDAMSAVVGRLPNAQLTVLGEGPLRAELTEQAQRLGLTEKVHFMGFQQNPWAYFRHADLFVLPSRYEGVSNALLEALALETKVVATECPGAMREVWDSGVRMVLIPPEDTGALAEAIVAGCRMPRRRGESDELKERLSRFDLQQIVGEYSKLLLS